MERSTFSNTRRHRRPGHDIKPARWFQTSPGARLKTAPSVGHCGFALAMLCVGWAVHHVREKQCTWRNPSDAPGLGCLGDAFDGESVPTVWSGVQASLTRLGEGREHLPRCCFSFSTLEKMHSSRVGLKPSLQLVPTQE
jgi:hypothetical protein